MSNKKKSGMVKRTATVNFNLKQNDKKTTGTVIMVIRVSGEKKAIRIFTKYRVPAEKWDTDLQRPTFDYDHFQETADGLEEMQDIALNVLNDPKRPRDLSLLKDEVESMINGKIVGLFLEYALGEWLKQKSKSISNTSVKIYRHNLNKFKEFLEDAEGAPDINFDKVDLSIRNDFIEWLSGIGFSETRIAQALTIIQMVLKDGYINKVHDFAHVTLDWVLANDLPNKPK